MLQLLQEKDHYSYELVAKISTSVEISEGTIYPLLRRLKYDSFVSTYVEESSEGPPRWWPARLR